MLCCRIQSGGSGHAHLDNAHLNVFMMMQESSNQCTRASERIKHSTRGQWMARQPASQHVQHTSHPDRKRSSRVAPSDCETPSLLARTDFTPTDVTRTDCPRSTSGRSKEDRPQPAHVHGRGNQLAQQPAPPEKQHSHPSYQPHPHARCAAPQGSPYYNTVPPAPVLLPKDGGQHVPGKGPHLVPTSPVFELHPGAEIPVEPLGASEQLAVAPHPHDPPEPPVQVPACASPPAKPPQSPPSKAKPQQRGESPRGPEDSGNLIPAEGPDMHDVQAHMHALQGHTHDCQGHTGDPLILQRFLLADADPVSLAESIHTDRAPSVRVQVCM
jgi:hypothetical protein